MKSIPIICSIFLLFLFSLLNAQENKRNNNWAIGFSPVVIFNFNNNEIVIDSLNFPILSESACISDKQGQLEFFTSTFVIFEHNGEIIENGFNINCP
jgi:hypothetical protein